MGKLKQDDLGKTLGRNGAPHHIYYTRAANQQTQMLVGVSNQQHHGP